MDIENENEVTAGDMSDAPSDFEHIPTLSEAAQPVAFEELPMQDTDAYVDNGLDAVHEVPVRMQAILGRARMTVAELMQMRPGRVVELDRKIGEPVDILVNDRLIARGEVVMVDKVLGVTLTEIVREED